MAKKLVIAECVFIVGFFLGMAFEASILLWAKEMATLTDVIGLLCTAAVWGITPVLVYLVGRCLARRSETNA